MFDEQVPSQCPECGSIDVRINRVAPSSHERGDEWSIRAECRDCNDYTEWFG